MDTYNLILQNVNINSYRLFHTYFDFQQIYSLLKSEDAYIFSEFCRDSTVMPRSLPQCRLVGINDTSGKHNENTGALRLIAHPELCLEENLMVRMGEFIPLFREEGGHDGQVLVRVNNLEAFQSDIFFAMQQSCCKLDDTYKQPASQEKIRRSVVGAIAEITENGKRLFTLEAATEMYLYFLLHALAAVLPDDISGLKEDMARLCPVSEQAAYQAVSFPIQEKAGNAQAPLSYYPGKPQDNTPLSIIELPNNSSKSVTVRITGTVLFREVPADQSVYALRKGNQIVSFLPRFRLKDQMVTYQAGGVLYNECNGIREKVLTAIPRPVSWVISYNYGNFIIDQEGALDKDASWPEVFPDKPVVMVDAFADDYCMLLNDGTVVSACGCPGWEGRYLGISLGLNAGIAIDTQRKAVRLDRKEIPNFQAVEAKAYCEHYICMDARGQVKSDRLLNLDGKVYGIAICSHGYVLAFEDRICLDGFNGSRKEWPIPKVSEIEADDQGFAYFDGRSGEIRYQAF